MKKENSTFTLRQPISALLQMFAVLVSIGLYWLFQVLPFQKSGGFSWQNFRNYFPFDQYSYLAIAVNVMNGNTAAVEPFTETGSNNYPRLYYVLLGHVARILDIDIIVAWQMVGIGFQLLMVAAVSLLLIRLSGIWFIGALGFLPFMFGTFASLVHDGWYHTLDNHAVLWGPFGVFATLNGESAALSIAVSIGCVLIATIFPKSTGRSRRTKATTSRTTFMAVVGSSAGIGLLANVQTYSFLTTTYLFVYVAAAVGLLTYGRWMHYALSATFLISAVTTGSVIANLAGPLAVLVAGAVAALPGLWLLARKYIWTVLASAVALIITSAPTIVGTLLGLVNADPFLTYREVSSTNLGVPVWEGLFAGLVPILFLLLIFCAGIYRGRRIWVAYASGTGIAWALVANNDSWGANQEPYRFWIDSFAIITVLSFAIVVQIICQISKEIMADRQSAELVIGTIEPTQTEDEFIKTRRKSGKHAVSVLAVSTLIISLISLVDYPRFASYASGVGTSSFSSAQMDTIEALTKNFVESPSGSSLQLDSSGRARGLIMTDSCIDVLKFKVVTGLPTAFYNLGLAWPTHEPQIRELLVQSKLGKFDPSLAQSAGVRYLVTDSSCASTLDSDLSLYKVAEAEYPLEKGEAAVKLWQINE